MKNSLEDALKESAEEKFKLVEINKRLQKTNRRLKTRLDKINLVLIAAIDTFEKLTRAECNKVRAVSLAGLSLAKDILEEDLT